MSVSPTSKTLNIGETVQLTGTKNPSTTSEGTQWTSSNTSVATVSNSGLVTAKSAGTATITFKNSSSTKSASCTVKVINIEYIVGTGSHSVFSSNGYGLIKYNSSGSEVWTTSASQPINSVAQTSDGGYIVGTGSHSVFSSNGYGLIKYNSSGSVVWTTSASQPINSVIQKSQ